MTPTHCLSRFDFALGLVFVVSFALGVLLLFLANTQTLHLVNSLVHFLVRTKVTFTCSALVLVGLCARMTVA